MKWKKTFNSFLSIAFSICLLTLCTGCGSSRGESGGNYPTPENPKTIKWGLSISTKSVIYEKAMQVKAAIEESTDGAVILDIYPSSQLGSESVMLDGILSGTIDMANISTNTVSTVIPNFNAFTLPFVFENPETFWNVAHNTEFTSKVSEMSSEYGIEFLGMLSMFNRGIISKAPVVMPEDLQGMKLRLMSGHTFSDMFSSWNAGTIIMPFNEVYTALQQNVIDGLCCPIDGGIDQKFFEVAPYYVDTNHTTHFTASLINAKVWDCLSSEQQQAFHNAFSVVTSTGADEYYEQYSALLTQAEEEFDITYTRLTHEQRAHWKEAVEWMYDDYEYIDSEFLDWFLELIRENTVESDRY